MKTYTDEEIQIASVNLANEREEFAKALLPCNRNSLTIKPCKGHAEICGGMEGIWVECSHCSRQTVAYEDDFEACLEWNQLILFQSDPVIS